VDRWRREKKFVILAPVSHVGHVEVVLPGGEKILSGEKKKKFSCIWLTVWQE
jgi:hypothetical protein